MSVPPVRSTKNRQIEEKDSGAHFDRAFNAPAHETANARVRMIGPFRKANLGASQAATAMAAGGAVDSDAPTQVRMHSSGHILALVYDFDALVTAGGASAATIQPTVAPGGVLANVANAATGNVVVASAASGNPQGGPVDLIETKYSKGDALGVSLASAAGFTPTTVDVAVWLVVRDDASPGVPA